MIALDTFIFIRTSVAVLTFVNRFFTYITCFAFGMSDMVCRLSIVIKIKAIPNYFIFFNIRSYCCFVILLLAYNCFNLVFEYPAKATSGIFWVEHAILFLPEGVRSSISVCTPSNLPASLISKVSNAGEEKGYFEFGGSTILVLLKENAIYFNEKLYERQNSDGEIPVDMGECVAKTKKGRRLCNVAAQELLTRQIQNTLSPHLHLHRLGLTVDYNSWFSPLIMPLFPSGSLSQIDLSRSLDIPCCFGQIPELFSKQLVWHNAIFPVFSWNFVSFHLPYSHILQANFFHPVYPDGLCHIISGNIKLIWMI